MIGLRGVLVAALWWLLLPMACVRAAEAEKATPLIIGDTFTIDSRILGERRRINVYSPPGYTQSRAARLPVLYMPDGGMAEDFLHVAGLVQVSVGNGTMRPFLLVGIENTERRRDLTGPTENESDKKIAPRVGGSEAFRQFIRNELMPAVNRRYRTTGETAIVGESLAGLFVVETFLREPDLFSTYIAFDPSLWWNNQALVKGAAERLRAQSGQPKTLYFASSDEKGIAEITERFAEILGQQAPAGLRWHYEPMPGEKHSTIYHPAALKAFRAVFKPNTAEGELEAREFDMKGCIALYHPKLNRQVVINDESALRSFIWNDRRFERCLADLKRVDLSKYTLLGVEINSGWCRRPLGLTHRVMKDESQKRYLLRVTYQSPGEPCRALSQYDLWVLVPKLPDGYKVDFEVSASSPDDKPRQ